jgi:hypothetical protein
MPIQTADCPVTNDVSPNMAAFDQERIATSFGQLTRAEIQEWEEMLGRPLLHLPAQS